MSEQHAPRNCPAHFGMHDVPCRKGCGALCIAQDAEKINAALKDAQEKLDELSRGFNLRWKADRRAIKRWQEATGRSLTWPDHADLCVWLLERLEAEGAMQGHEERCYYCDISCNVLSANPGDWPLGFAHEDQPGKLRWHHVSCVQERLRVKQRKVVQIAVAPPSNNPSAGLSLYALCDDGAILSIEEYGDAPERRWESLPEIPQP